MNQTIDIKLILQASFLIQNFDSNKQELLEKKKSKVFSTFFFFFLCFDQQKVSKKQKARASIF